MGGAVSVLPVLELDRVGDVSAKSLASISIMSSSSLDRARLLMVDGGRNAGNDDGLDNSVAGADDSSISGVDEGRLSAATRVP